MAYANNENILPTMKISRFTVLRITEVKLWASNLKNYWWRRGLWLSSMGRFGWGHEKTSHNLYIVLLDLATSALV